MPCFRWKGCQDIAYELLSQIHTYISHDTRYCLCLQRLQISHLSIYVSNGHLDYGAATLEINDAMLTLIFRMRQAMCGYWFCLSLQPIPHLWMAATNRHLGYPRCKAKIHWRPVGAHCQDRVVTVPCAIVPIKAANMLVIHSRDQITIQWSYW